MKDPQNITICLLLATGTILASLLVSSYMTTDNAAYATVSIKQGDYILATGARSGTKELVYVLDIAARRLNVYDTNTTNWTLELVDMVDVDRAFKQ